MANAAMNAGSNAAANVAPGASGARPEQAAQPSAQAPVSRMRRAISAYLACAQGFGSSGPMLSAVA